MVGEPRRQNRGPAAKMVSMLFTGTLQQPERSCEILRQDWLHEDHGSVVNTPMPIGTVLLMHSSLLHSMTKVLMAAMETYIGATPTVVCL